MEYLASSSLNKALSSEILDSVVFLNEISNHYPNAISFVAGRPKENHCDVENTIEHINYFVKYTAAKKELNFSEVFNTLGQYGNTKGIINDII